MFASDAITRPNIFFKIKIEARNKKFRVLLMFRKCVWGVILADT